MNYFTQHLYLPTWKQHLIIAFLFGVFTFMEIWLYQPFDTSEYHASGKNVFLSGYGVVVTLSYILSYAVPLILYLKIYGQKKWNWFKESGVLVLFLTVTALLTRIYHHQYFGHTDYSFTSFLYWLQGTFILGFFLFVLLFLWKWHKTKKPGFFKNGTEKASTVDLLTLYGSNKKNQPIQIKASELIYLRSEKNYIELFCHKKEEIKKHILRNTLENMQKQLSGNEFIRIHRSYLINKNYAVKLFTRRSMYFILITEPKKIELPVSRKYLDTVRSILQAR